MFYNRKHCLWGRTYWKSMYICCKWGTSSSSLKKWKEYSSSLKKWKEYKKKS